MRAGLGDAAALEHVDAVGVHDRGQPVRDQDRHHVLARPHLADRLADLLLGQRVERRRRLVEDQQVRPAQQRARDRQALLLAARHLHAALADHRVQPLRRRAPAGCRTRPCAARPGTPRRWRVGFTNSRFSRMRAGEELRVLRHEADPLAQLVQVHVDGGVAVVEDVAGLRPVEPDQQLDERRLARARGPDERDRVAARRRRRRCRSAPATRPSGAGS